MVDVEVPPWIKGLPVAPEYRPSEAEFVDPVSFVLRIEEEASQYGICKIVPPTPKPPRKAILPYLQQSIAAAHQGKNRPINRLGVVKFATRRQGLGGDGAAPPGGSGGSYSLDQFEAKSKAFSKGMVGTSRDVVPVVLEAMFWKKIEDAEAVSVEVSEKIPGSAFPENAEDQRQGGGERVKRKKIKTSPFDREGWKLVNSAWNLRYLAGLPGSMARFVEDEVVEGVTAPLLYVSMLFSRWEWKIDENDLHLVEHLHLGGPKTWYVVPAAAAVAFEDLMRKQDQNSIVSPEVLVLNGVPCCRIVQNPGEYVIVFPRAYHFSLTHSFTCGETSSLATPAWLNAAKQAAARRDFVSRPPIVCHEKLLYQTALAFAESSHTQDIRSSRLKHKMKAGAEEATRTEFVKDFLKNQHILDKLVSTAQARRVMLKSVANPASSDGEKENICKLVNLDAIDSISLLSFVCETMEGGDGKGGGGDRVPGADESNAHRIDWGNVSCSVCGIRCYSCVVILQPTSKASENIQAGMVTSTQADTGLRKCHRSQNGSIGTNTKKRNGIKSDNQMHPCIVCPEHGLQLSMLLQECGGCFVLVVHHPDYETFDKHAKDFATELNKRVRSGDPAYDQVTEQDLQLISTATNEERDTGWIARVESSLPKVCLSSESSSDSDSDDSEISAQKEKKVLGRWCGRVWRHDQTHAALGGSKSAPKIEDDPEENINNTTNRNASDEETAGRSDDCASIRTNCRKRKRTQMTAIWRVESERARVKSEGLTDQEPVQFEVKVIEPGEERSSSEGLRALPGLVCKEETGSDVKSEMLEPIGHGDISEPRVILDCNGAVRKETLVDCKQESETRHRSDEATNSALDTEVISASRDEKSKNKQIELVEKPSSVRIDPRVSRRSTRCCSNSNSIIWFDVPISFSPTFRSSYMKRSPTAAYRSPVTTSGIPKRKRTRAASAMEDRKEHKKEATDEDRECDGEDGGDEAEDPIQNDTPAPAPARTRARTRARTPASALASVSVSAPAPAPASVSVSASASLEDDAVDDETVIESRTKRTKRKSWKAMAAEDEQQARALRKGAAAKTSSASSEEDVKPTEMAMIRRHACDLDGCTMSFGSAAELCLHKRNICTVKECSKRLCSHSYLAQHYRVHGDERPLACPWQGCGKTFKWAWARTEHVRVHTGARPYACADCGKSYRQQQAREGEASQASPGKHAKHANAKPSAEGSECDTCESVGGICLPDTPTGDDDKGLETETGRG